MKTSLETELKSILSFDSVEKWEIIQSLWSGYGSLLRVKLQGSSYDSVIVKRITPPLGAQHPRGWNSELGHQRKLKSYEVECHWYANLAKRGDDSCRIPQYLGHKEISGGMLLVMEDLDQAGYPLRKNHLTPVELKKCLSWLAHFHSRFLQTQSEEITKGLWPIGTYWQLETRTEEYDKMPSGPLKDAASMLHQTLKGSRFQTLVHGDAKYANFCFAPDGRVAAVDFQYVGGGCGMKDVAYLLSCIPGDLSLAQESDLLDAYFKDLKDTVRQEHPNMDTEALEADWRPLYVVARADFERFLQGWAPGHWKSTNYAERCVIRAVSSLSDRIKDKS
ncbi:phosphotransferase [bacterium SCSIO 12741]|nr:phosphotransferase [bacterium SCSIO 12741]